MERAAVSRSDAALNPAGGVRRRLAALGCAAAVCAPGVAAAHPHMWIDASATWVFDDQGRLSAVRQTWEFDEMFTAYALLGLPQQAGGGYAADTLAPLTDEWMEALAAPQTHFFSGVRQGGSDAPRLPFAAGRAASMRWLPASGRIAMTFELPLQQPVAVAGAPVRLDVFDPTYYVAYDFGAAQAVTLENAPAACQTRYHRPQALDWQTAAKLAELPADLETLPEELFLITRSLSHHIELNCG